MKLSFHFGLNLVDWRAPQYAGWQGLLKNPRSDAAAELAIAERSGFAADCYFDSDVTRSRLQGILDDANNLNAPDTLLLTFSGHGSMDQAICLFDGLLFDEELHNAIAPLRCDTIVVLDSCFSGGMDRDYDPRLRKKVMPAAIPGAFKRDAWPPVELDDVQGRFLLLSAASDSQFALDGYGRNGAFTECRLAAFQTAVDAKQNFTWRHWQEAASGRCALNYPTQTPQLKLHGKNADALADALVIT